MEPINFTLASVMQGIESGRIKPHDGYECHYCYNSGFRKVHDPQGRKHPDGTVYIGVVRCDQCHSTYFNRPRT